MKHLRSIIVISLGTLLAILSGVTALYGLALVEYKGYSGYCSYDELPYIVPVYLLEMLLAIVLLTVIAHKLARPDKLILKLTYVDGVIAVLWFNLGFLAYQIMSYPRVMKIPILTKRPNDQHLGLDYSPYIGLWLVWAFILLWISTQRGRRSSNILFRGMSWSVLAMGLWLAYVLYKNMDYQMCMG